MKIKSFSNMLQKIRGLEQKLTKKFEQDTGFSLTRYEILVYLQEYGSSLQTEIAKYLQIDPAAITRHLKILEAKGYVDRERNKANAREIFVSLTSYAKEELSKCEYKNNEEKWDKIFPFAENDIEVLLALLTKMENKLN